jgi:dolichol kinase|mmetsp:Transcript_20650/g.3342  ORF Transcript_20650/g.3342 Transcript_20650/m.3342 type:complete len:144 (+) Transcript_20650:130-561(+)
MATGVIILFLCFSLDERLHTTLLGIPAVLFFLFDYIRRKKSDRLNNIIIRNFSQLLRPEEIVNRPMGAVMFLFGLFIAFLINSRPEVRTVSILYLSLIDPTASITGIMIPSPIIYMKKSVSGCVSSVLIALLCTITANALHAN